MFPINMERFNGKKVCGRPAKFSFLNMTRPNLDGQCPYGYTACDESASVDNKACVDVSGYSNPARGLHEYCPIVELKIERKEDYPGWESEVGEWNFEETDTSPGETNGWVSVELNDELIIRYKKTGDKLPISSW